MSDTWLAPAEQSAWRAYVRLQGELSARLGRQLQGDAQLSLPDYAVLVELSEAPEGRLRPYALAACLHWEQSRLSHHLSRMQRRGLVDRVVCTEDARGAFVVLTDAGRRVVEAAAPAHAVAVRELLFDGLSAEEVATFERICRKVVERLDPTGDEPD